MFTADDYVKLGSLGVERVCVALPLTTDITDIKSSRTLVLIGHSAAGKSAALTRLPFDRSQRDMDVYCQQHRVPPTIDVLLEMAAALAECHIIIASNDSTFLTALTSSRRDERLERFLFVYLRRPPEMVYSHLSLENTDGQYHRPMPFPDYKVLYKSFHSLYELIYDIEIQYNGNTIPNLSRIVCICLTSFIGEKMQSPEDLPTHTSSPSCSGDSVPDAKTVTAIGESFSEYFELLRIADASNKQFIALTAPEMTRITAGGYQSFNSATFPPKAAEHSIAATKWRDLKWTPSDFLGKSTLELGSQLGFFSFNAAALGATECVGVDLNKTFVNEANKIAINYKKFICRWPDDRVRFMTSKINVGDQFPLMDIVIANSIIHWWIIQNKELTLPDALKWLHSMCRYGVYFEGCVSATEEIMTRNSVSIDRYNEALFINSCQDIFSEVNYIGRCTYNKERVVLRLLK